MESARQPRPGSSGPRRVWALRRRSEIAEEARPAGDVVKDDRFDATASVNVLALTTDPADAPLVRLLIEADDAASPRELSRLMVEKVTSTPARSWATRLAS